MVAKARIRFTYEDYRSLPYVERQRFELLEGELIPVTPSPGATHQWLCGELAFHLRRFVKEHQLGRVYEAPLDVVLGEAGEEQVVQPDILFIAKERGKIIHEEEIRGAPDLVVEVLSPSTAEKDRFFKRTLYARHGVKEYWLADPDSKSIELLTLGERGYRRAGLYQKGQVLRSPLLGLEIPLAEIF